MDISAFKNLSAYSMNLADFLNTGSKSAFFDGASKNLMEKVNQTLAIAAEKTNNNANVSLSEEAQKLLANGNTNSKLTGVKQSAQNFLMGFFDQSGIDLKNLSDETLDIIDGLNGIIASSGATQRDMTTDAAESKYANGTRQSFTLVGTNTRLRISVEYPEGKPAKLSVTDITGGQVETAEFQFESSAAGKPVDTMTIVRTQREYTNGHMVSLDPIDPLSVKLYKAATTAA